jgi:hypothetical protein
MKYLCLGYFDRSSMDTLSKTEIEALMGECGPHTKELYRTGQVLLDVGVDVKSKCLRRVNGKLMTSDGPFIKGREMIGSAFIIEASDMDDAIRVASLHPSAQLDAGEKFRWGIEIRPIHYFEAPAKGM